MTERTGVIVVGVDGSEQALDAVRWAAAEAAPRNLRLRLVSDVDPATGFYGAGLIIPPGSIEAIAAAAHADLRHAERAVRAVAPDVSVEKEFARTQPIPALIEQSRTARMLVLGASGRGGYTGMLAGSTVASVVAHAHCPVVVVRQPLDPDGPVVVGVDGSALSTAALAAAFDEASWRRTPLVAVHSWSDADYETGAPPEMALLRAEPDEDEQARVLAESLAGWQEKYPDVPVERVVVKDRPRHQLLDRSAKARLVVVGSRGRGGFRGLLLGSTSQALVSHARCPVMVVRP